MPFLVNLHQLDKANIRLQGELNAEELDMEDLDELIHFRRPLTYDVEIQKDRENLLLQGRWRVSLDCECARCLKAYRHDIQLDEWTCLVPLAGESMAVTINDSVDLTPYLREDIVLALPPHPVCGPDCPGIRSQQRDSVEKKAAEQETKSSPWNELDKLEFGN